MWLDTHASLAGEVCRKGVRTFLRYPGVARTGELSVRDTRNLFRPGASTTLIDR